MVERPRGEESPGSTGSTAPDNIRRGRPRESATEIKTAPACRVRVKGWGKSPPRTWQQGRHGKPRREQDRIGMTWRASARAVSGLVIRVGCVRRCASAVPDEWLPRSGRPGPYRTRLTGQLAIFLLFPGDARSPGGSVSAFAPFFFNAVLPRRGNTRPCRTRSQPKIFGVGKPSVKLNGL